MFKRVALLSILFVAVMVAAHPAHAGFTKLTTDGLPDTFTPGMWEDIDVASNTSFVSYCKSMNELYKTNITCSIDHQSFVDHYAVEMKKPKVDDRDGTGPGSYCATSGIIFFADRMSSITGSDSLLCADDAECNAAFKEQVKSIVCKYDASLATPKVSLADGVLTLSVTSGADGKLEDATNGDSWVRDGFLKVFAPYKKVWDSRH